MPNDAFGQHYATSRRFDDEVDQVSLPTENGEITILPHHASLVTTIHTGELIYKKHQKESHLAAGFGFAQIADNNVKGIQQEYFFRI